MISEVTEIVCNICKETKLLSEFHKKKGNKYDRCSHCKKCEKIRAREYRIKNKEIINLYKQTHKKEAKINRKKYYEEHKEQEKAYNKKYLGTKEGKKRLKEWSKRYKDKNKEKVKAHMLLNYAVRMGRVIKPNRCSYCKKVKKIDGHHFDYKKPLEVLWLCRQCHINLHKELKERLLLKGKLKTIYDTYGLKTQKLKLVEELAELIKEIVKNDGENIAKEMADVHIVMTGILQNNPNLKEIFDKEVEFKINRQIKRINN